MASVSHNYEKNVPWLWDKTVVMTVRGFDKMSFSNADFIISVSVV